MVKLHYIFILLLLTASCGKAQYKAIVELPEKCTAGQSAATAEALKKRLGQFGSIKDFATSPDGTFKISFTSSLGRKDIQRLITIPGEVGFSLLYTIGELTVFTETFEAFFEAERYHPDPGTEALFRAIYPAWAYEHSRPTDAVLAHLESHMAREVEASFGEPFWRQLIPGDGSPALKRSPAREDLYEFIVLRDFDHKPWNAHIESSKGGTDNYYLPVLNIKFDEEGAKKFAELTRVTTGRHLAVIMDGEVLTIPVVREEIRDGKLTIGGIDNPEDINLLSAVIHGGRLLVPVTVTSLRSDR